MADVKDSPRFSVRFYVVNVVFKRVNSRENASITKTCPRNIERFFSPVKIENFIRKKIDIFLIFAQNIDCGYLAS